jgi:phage-related minor tail protein
MSDRGSLVESSVDTLLRPGVTPAPPQSTTPENRAELTRILIAATADGSLSTSDRDYLAQVVAARTGVTPDVAQKRVEDAYATAVEAVETARQAAVAAGLATATALLLGLAAAWYAAQRGGHHRDQNIPARFTFLVMRKSV